MLCHYSPTAAPRPYGAHSKGNDMTTWNYYTACDGYLFDESGEREQFDGAKRSASEWDAYLEAQDIRGTVR